MENNQNKPPFKSFSIDLIDYQEIINPKDLLGIVVSDAVRSYIEQGVKVFVTYEGKPFMELTKENF